MAEFGNIKVSTHIRFPHQQPSYFSFELEYGGDGTESAMEFEKNLLDACHWLAIRFRSSQEQHHTKLYDAIYEKMRADYEAAAGL